MSRHWLPRDKNQLSALHLRIFTYRPLCQPPHAASLCLRPSLLYPTMPFHLSVSFHGMPFSVWPNLTWSLKNPGQTSLSLVLCPSRFCWSSELERHLAHLPVTGSIASDYSCLHLYPSACEAVSPDVRKRSFTRSYPHHPACTFPAWMMLRTVLAPTQKV